MLSVNQLASKIKQTELGKQWMTQTTQQNVISVKYSTNMHKSFVYACLYFSLCYENDTSGTVFQSWYPSDNIHPQMRIDPPFTERSEFTEWKTDALANQATMAG